MSLTLRTECSATQSTLSSESNFLSLGSNPYRVCDFVGSRPAFVPQIRSVSLTQAGLDCGIGPRRRRNRCSVAAAWNLASLRIRPLRSTVARNRGCLASQFTPLVLILASGMRLRGLHGLRRRDSHSDVSRFSRCSSSYSGEVRIGLLRRRHS